MLTKQHSAGSEYHIDSRAEGISALEALALLLYSFYCFRVCHVRLNKNSDHKQQQLKTGAPRNVLVWTNYVLNPASVAGLSWQ